MLGLTKKTQMLRQRPRTSPQIIDQSENRRFQNSLLLTFVDVRRLVEVVQVVELDRTPAGGGQATAIS